MGQPLSKGWWWLSCLVVWLFATPWSVACQAPLSMDSPGKNTGVGCHFLLQGIFPTQETNPGLLHCRQILYQLSSAGSVGPKTTRPVGQTQCPSFSEGSRHSLLPRFWKWQSLCGISVVCCLMTANSFHSSVQGPMHCNSTALPVLKDSVFLHPLQSGQLGLSLTYSCPEATTKRSWSSQLNNDRPDGREVWHPSRQPAPTATEARDTAVLTLNLADPPAEGSCLSEPWQNRQCKLTANSKNHGGGGKYIVFKPHLGMVCHPAKTDWSSAPLKLGAL